MVTAPAPFMVEVFPVDVLALASHGNVAACVLVGRRAPVVVDDGKHQVAGDVVLVSPGRLHTVRCGPGGADAIYFDDLATGERVPFARALQGAAALAAAQAVHDADCQALLQAELAHRAAALPAPVADTLRCLSLDPMHRMSQTELSRRLGMERTRALRYIKALTGRTFRTHKKWIGLKFAARQIMNGESVRTAALDAGFSDTAHLSRTFRSIFGMTPSLAAASLGRATCHEHRNGSGEV
jgi:AraC-like DNA-binding protein